MFGGRACAAFCYCQRISISAADDVSPAESAELDLTRKLLRRGGSGVSSRGGREACHCSTGRPQKGARGGESFRLPVWRLFNTMTVN